MAALQPEGTARRTIARLPGYEFDVDGGVWSYRIRGHRDLLADHPHRVSGTINSDGYLQVSLMDSSGKRCVRLVHHLILEAFCGRRPRRQECRHLDGCRTNNRLGNLRWGTSSDNNCDTVRHGRHHCQKLTIDRIHEIKTEATEGVKPKDLARKHGVSPTQIRRIVSGERWDKVISSSEGKVQ